MGNISTRFMNLPNIKATIDQFRLTPNKSMGQNFLLDGDIPDQMVSHAGNLKHQTVVEVGPGVGTLTRAILAGDAERLVAIEMDERCLRALQPLLQLSEGRLELLHADAMQFSWVPVGRYHIIANLPYNIATTFLVSSMEQESVEQIIVMIQYEVAKRFAASPSTSDYGKLSVLSQSRWHVELLFNVPSCEFYPTPKVTSTVMHLIPRSDRLCLSQYIKLKQLVSVAFSQRRKMVRAALGRLFAEPELVLERIGADPRSRAEQLSVKQYIAMTELMA